MKYEKININNEVATMKLLLFILFVNVFGAEQFIEWGLSARKGDRTSMEDTQIAIIPFRGNPSKALFGIFDGHGGVESAQLVAEKMPDFIPDFDSFTQSSLKEAFLNLDAVVLHSKINNSGTCALIAHMYGELLHVAWVGDSRAVLCRNNNIILATTDHKPDALEERLRINTHGGKVIKLPKDVARVEGVLAVSRSFGDSQLKSKGFIVAEPYIKEHIVQPNDILILGCDGIWDVFKNEEACTFVNNALLMSQDDLSVMFPKIPVLRNSGTPDTAVLEDGDEKIKLIARALRDEAYNKGSRDNISVQIIKFK